ncbi:hypothetical protein CICLE_v10026880mg [Citrus x clementina]|uniref:Secreted protein n=1 Tax=Citrus clementina TaxID=85681 RepID=V4SJE1_CITCL|nr:hypothetical protein CICLE_v10026880mg [Citrus x clementina]
MFILTLRTFWHSCFALCSPFLQLHFRHPKSCLSPIQQLYLEAGGANLLQDSTCAVDLCLSFLEPPPATITRPRCLGL